MHEHLDLKTTKATADRVPELLDGHCSLNCPWYIGCDAKEVDQGTGYDWSYYPNDERCPHFQKPVVSTVSNSRQTQE